MTANSLRKCFFSVLRFLNAFVTQFIHKVQNQDCDPAWVQLMASNTDLQRGLEALEGRSAFFFRRKQVISLHAQAVLLSASSSNRQPLGVRTGSPYNCIEYKSAYVWGIHSFR